MPSILRLHPCYWFSTFQRHSCGRGEHHVPFVLSPMAGGAVQSFNKGGWRPAAAHNSWHPGVRRCCWQQQLVRIKATAAQMIFPHLQSFECQSHLSSSVNHKYFGGSLFTTSCLCFCSWQPIIDHIDSKFEDYLNSESRVNRRQMPDSRIHCCLYFIAPSGHGWVGKTN